MQVYIKFTWGIKNQPILSIYQKNFFCKKQNTPQNLLKILS